LRTIRAARSGACSRRFRTFSAGRTKEGIRD
jgi:hypothetical protein